MAKSKTVFVCQNCGAKESKWVGKCSTCGEWNSFVEEVEVSTKGNRVASIVGASSSRPLKLSEVKANADDVASVVVTLTNQTGEAVEFEAVITGNQLITKKEKVSLDAGQSKKIYATFTKIIKEEKRVVTVTVPDMNKVSKSITVEPFFVNF